MAWLMRGPLPPWRHLFSASSPQMLPAPEPPPPPPPPLLLISGLKRKVGGRVRSKRFPDAEGRGRKEG